MNEVEKAISFKLHSSGPENCLVPSKLHLMNNGDLGPIVNNRRKVMNLARVTFVKRISPRHDVWVL